jgi:hypothetical protein
MREVTERSDTRHLPPATRHTYDRERDREREIDREISDRETSDRETRGSEEKEEHVKKKKEKKEGGKDDTDVQCECASMETSRRI